MVFIHCWSSEVKQEIAYCFSEFVCVCAARVIVFLPFFISFISLAGCVQKTHKLCTIWNTCWYIIPSRSSFIFHSFVRFWNNKNKEAKSIIIRVRCTQFKTMDTIGHSIVVSVLSCENEFFCHHHYYYYNWICFPFLYGAAKIMWFTATWKLFNSISIQFIT